MPPEFLRTVARSPRRVLRENVIAVLHQRVAREPAFGVVTLRRLVSRGCGRECVGRGVIVERAPSPSAAVYEPLAVLHHEINVMLGTWHRWLSGVRFLLFRVPMDLRHLSAIWERLAVTGHALLIGIDHYGVPDDRSHNAFVLTDRDYWPAFVSPELGECESARYLHSVLVLRGNGCPAQDG